MHAGVKATRFLITRVILYAALCRAAGVVTEMQIALKKMTLQREELGVGLCGARHAAPVCPLASLRPTSLGCSARCAWVRACSNL